MSPIATNPSGRKMKPLPKLIALCLVVAGLIGGLKIAANHGLLPSVGILKAIVPEKANLPDVKDAQIADVTPQPIPTSSSCANPSATLIRGQIWEWNAQMGLIYANGGSCTTKDSLMAKRNVNLNLERQDDTGQMQNSLIACAKELKDGATQCSSGANFVIIMGDGSGQFLSAVNPQLKKLGPDYQAVIIGSVGYSRGEDKLMGPPEWKSDPSQMKGSVILGVLRDGDWDIALKYIGDNGLKNNPDEKTWDPDAVNWINAPDYNKAAEMYNAEYCEDRQVVKEGRLTGETKHVCANGVVTWTPGDVTIAHGRGGLVSVVSSKQYSSQMPSVIIGPRKFFKDNRAEVENMLAAAFEGADQIRAFPDALKRAGEISAKLYNDQNGAYWVKYYKGVKEGDIELGGSKVNGLADNLVLFGLQPGANNNMRSTYTIFAKICTQQYPNIFKEQPIPDYKEIADTSFLTGAQSALNGDGGTGAAAEEENYQAEAAGSQVSRRSWDINFETGSAQLTPEGVDTVRELKDQLAITKLFINVEGHTDNTGSEPVNKSLSQARAEAVKNWLQAHAPANFPDSRFRVSGYGSSRPKASNATPSGRAANRRVEIALIGE